MLVNRIKVFRHLTFRELCLLLAGKINASFRKQAYRELQDKENKLSVLYEHSKNLVFIGDTARLVVRLFGMNVSCQLRLQGSDVFVFQQTIVNESYKDVVALYRKSFNVEPRTIVDAGANIGLASLYFSALCPDSVILAIEPDTNNIEIAREHIRSNNFGKVDVRQAALWPETKMLSLVNDFRDRLNWSFRVEPDKMGDIPAITPAQMVDHFKKEIDLFKIDIEGGEAQLFQPQADFEWLKHVKMVAIEVHDEYIKTSEVRQILEDYGFAVQHLGELTVGINSYFQKNNGSYDIGK
jgi:FkbM family methyltransferase